MKARIMVEIEFKAARSPEGEPEFVSIKCIGVDAQTCPLPRDVPAPRRLAKDLALAASLAGLAALESEALDEQLGGRMDGSPGDG